MVDGYGVVMVVLNDIDVMISKVVMTVNGYGLVMESILFINSSCRLLVVACCRDSVFLLSCVNRSG